MTKPKARCKMPTKNARRTATLIVALMLCAAGGCAPSSPVAVDPQLREAADHFAGLVSAGDGPALSTLNAGKDDGRLADLLAAYGGVETHPLAYESEGASTAIALFTVECSSGSQTLHQVFVYVSGRWRPNLESVTPPADGPIPRAGWPTSVVPTEAPVPACQ